MKVWAKVERKNLDLVETRAVLGTVQEVVDTLNLWVKTYGTVTLLDREGLDLFEVTQEDLENYKGFSVEDLDEAKVARDDLGHGRG